jgi:hypothetical protein
MVTWSAMDMLYINSVEITLINYRQHLVYCEFISIGWILIFFFNGIIEPQNLILNEKYKLQDKSLAILTWCPSFAL